MKTNHFYSFLTIICIVAFTPWSLAQSQWTSLGPQGGYFVEFAVHPTNPNIIFAGGDNASGVWKSSDAGNTWQLATHAHPNTSGWEIKFAPSNPDIIFVGDYTGRQGLLRSDDGGDTWTPLLNSLAAGARRRVNQVFIVSDNADTLLISTGRDIEGYIYRSTDGGQTWSFVLAGGTGLTGICQSSTTGRLFASTDGIGFYYSDDGVSWIRHNDIDSTAFIWSMEYESPYLAVASINNTIYLSSDDGLTFQNLGPLGATNVDIAITQTTPSVELVAAQYGSVTIYDGASGNWQMATSPLLDNQIIYSVGTDGSIIYTGAFNNDPIVRSTDGGATWNYLPQSPTATYIEAIAVDPNNTNRIVASSHAHYDFAWPFNHGSLYLSDDSGANWTRLGPNGFGTAIRFVPSQPNTLYFGTFSQGLFKSTDGLTTWTNVRSGNRSILDIIVDDTDPNIVFISELEFGDSITVGLYKSIDGGNSFAPTFTQEVVNRIIQAPGTDTFYLATPNGMYLSDDGGDTWALGGLFGFNILSLGWHKGNLVMGTQLGQVTLNNNGIPFNISGPWDAPVEVRNLFSIGDTLYVGMSGVRLEFDTTYARNSGLWRTYDEGQTWEDLTDGLTHSHFYGNTAITAQNGQLLVAPYGGGIFRLDPTTVSTKPVAASTPTLQVYPNPCDDYCRIVLPEINSPTAILQLYEASGRLVRSMSVATNNEAIELLTADLPIGLYYFSLHSTQQIVGSGKLLVR